MLKKAFVQGHVDNLGVPIHKWHLLAQSGVFQASPKAMPDRRFFEHAVKLQRYLATRK